MICKPGISISGNAQSKEDSLALEKACRNYVEGWATGDMDRVAEGVKFHGEWRILNVLWGLLPQKK
jgi:hypothetical protein